MTQEFNNLILHDLLGMQQQQLYFLTLSIRRNKILLRAELVVGEVPVTSLKCMQRDITVFTFVTIAYEGNVHLSVIFSDVKAEKSPHAKNWSLQK